MSIEESSEFKTWVKDMFSEREKLFNEKLKVIKVQIQGIKEQTKSSFNSSEKAITKAENAQSAYNARSNEFRASLDDAQQNFVSISRFDDLKKDLEAYKDRQATEIRVLRESKSLSEGKSAGSSATWAIVVTIVGILGALFGYFFKQ